MVTKLMEKLKHRRFLTPGPLWWAFDWEGAERPVNQVNWENTMAFTERLNAQVDGLNLRLPTEAQWEYACRAGTQTPFWFGDNITTDQVNYHGDYPYAEGKKGEFREHTVEVKALPCKRFILSG
jgi:sulfatase modifying factor 1